RWGFIDGRARQIYAERYRAPFPTGKVLLGPLPNVWLGVSVEDDATACTRIPFLLDTPAAKRWISAEPLLGFIDLEPYIQHRYLDHVATMPRLDWVVVGGESGPNARPMHPDWARGLRDQCVAAGVPFLFKQWGEWTEIDTGLPQPLLAHFGDPEFYDAAVEHDGFLSLDGHFVDNPDLMNDDVPYRGLVRVGKKAAGRLLDGRTWDGVPS
ncbi:MAG: hypothetical protein CVU23_06190, partial [Betaproteobacteria bacterium HGW-Betaproteobacteria-17]